MAFKPVKCRYSLYKLIDTGNRFKVIGTERSK